MYLGDGDLLWTFDFNSDIIILKFQKLHASLYSSSVCMMHTSTLVHQDILAGECVVQRPRYDTEQTPKSVPIGSVTHFQLRVHTVCKTYGCKHIYFGIYPKIQHITLFLPRYAPNEKNWMIVLKNRWHMTFLYHTLHFTGHRYWGEVRQTSNSKKRIRIAWVTSRGHQAKNYIVQTINLKLPMAIGHCLSQVRRKLANLIFW